MSQTFSGLTRPKQLLILAAAATAAAILSASIMFKESKKKESKKSKAGVTKEPVVPHEETKANKSWADDVIEEEEVEVKISEVTSAMANLGIGEDEVPTPVRRDSGIGSPDEATEAVVESIQPRPSSPSSEVVEKIKEKNRSDSGCSYETSDEAKAEGKVTSADSGNGSTEDTGGIVFAYHFSIPSHLCGMLIGVKGAAVKQLRAATKCDLTLVRGNYEIRAASKYDKKADLEPQVCIIEGTRAGIDRCLLLIREKFPLEQFPDLSLEQINLPSQKEVSAYRNKQPTEAAAAVMPLQLVPGQTVNVIVSSIVTGGLVFVQQPDHPSFSALERLEFCMSNVYEKLGHRVPKVNRDIVEPGLVCVAKYDDRYYRLQIVAYDASQESCEVKFLDYGGYDVANVDDLWQIRSDFLTLPFQAVECYLSNVIPPTGSEWPFESVVHLEELLRNQNNSCRVIGVSTDMVPIVQLYSTSLSKETNEIETRFVNKELVERGAAIWVEHSLAA